MDYDLKVASGIPSSGIIWYNSAVHQ
jgi:hypothetical protein